MKLKTITCPICGKIVRGANGKIVRAYNVEFLKPRLEKHIACEHPDHHERHKT